MINVRSNRYVFERSRSALYKLLKSKNIDELTVRDIAREAGFSRQYFYRFYDDKSQLLTDVLLDILQEGLGIIFVPFFDLRKFLTVVQRESGFLKALFSSEYFTKYYLLLHDWGMLYAKTMAEATVWKILSPEQSNALSVYLYGALSTVYSRCLQGERLDAVELADAMHHSLPECLKEFAHEEIVTDIFLYKIEKKHTTKNTSDNSEATNEFQFKKTI